MMETPLLHILLFQWAVLYYSGFHISVRYNRNEQTRRRRLRL
jgi:hypothetical protein